MTKSTDFPPALFSKLTGRGLVRLTFNIECDPLTRALADRLAKALDDIDESRRPLGRPKGRRKYEPTHQDVALRLLPLLGDSLPNHELTRRLAKEAQTSINTAGNAVRSLIRAGKLTVDGRGKAMVVTRVIL